MSGIFLGLEIGLRSLRSHQQALNVTAHNIANSNAPGYTRQQAQLQATLPQTQHGIAGQIGTGVRMHQVARMRDMFLDGQLRNEIGRYQMQSTIKRGLDQIQSFFNEPSDNGLQAAMNEFWNAMGKMANDPESDASRRTVVATADAMADTFRRIAGQLNELRADIDFGIGQKISHANSVCSQIASLNEQIRNAMLIQDQQPNDLKDQRDLLVDELSALTKCQVSESADGMLTVTIGGRAVVSGTTTETIAYSDADSGPQILIGGVDIVGAAGAAALGGDLGGSFELKDGLIMDYLSDLDRLAYDLIRGINEVHRSGWGLEDSVHQERDFFAGTGASDFFVSAEIGGDPSKVAASSNGLIGDGSCALRMLALQDELRAGSGVATFGDFYQGLIGKLGVKASEVNRSISNQRLLIKEIEIQREDVQGVWVDEELTNMVRFQHAYNAAARLVTAVDEMLETIIHRMGITGR